MISYITNRNIRVYNADNQISHNSDYIAKFVFDDEWNGKIKTARFIQDDEHFDVILVNNKCKIPPLKEGHIKIGVFTDSMTSTYADVYFKTSIKDGIDIPEPPEGGYEQLISLIESGMLKGEDGLTPYIGSNNNWWIGDIDTGVLARGTDGEDGYTPVKGVDYFTEEEVQQIQNEVSGGAIGDFKAVVDEETATFNTNAENTLTSYNANAQEKFDTYNTNADSKFETYNTNAETKFSGYNSNAEAKLSEYNQNDLDKTASYNTNADSKFATYNANAETKFSEYTNNAKTKLSEYNQNDSYKTALYNANAESKFNAYDNNAQAKLDLYNQNDSEKTEAYNSNAQTKLAAYNENADERISELNTQTEQIQNELKILATETAKFDANAKKKLEDYDSNAEAKLIEYNSNDSQKTSAYNQNHTEKLTAYDTNAEQHTTDYNRNAEQKLEAYNQNHTAKVAEYNQNAETKTAEFDANAAALQTEVDRLTAEKANVDGYYEEMTVGDAEQLISSMYAENSEPYGYRTTGGSADVGNRAYLDKIVGGTVAWNQLIDGDEHDPNVTYVDGRFIVSNYSGTGTFVLDNRINLIKGHKYFIEASSKLNNCIFYIYTFDYKSSFISAGGINKDSFSISHIAECSNTDTYRMYLNRYGATEDTPVTNYGGYFQLFDLTQMFGSTIADYIYSLEQSQAGAGVAWFKKLFPKDYYEYNAGELLSVEGLQSHDTVGFNQWDEEWEVGMIELNGQNANDNTRIRCKNYIPCIDNATYYVATPADVQLMYYDENKNFIGYQESSKKNTTFKPMNGSHYMRFYLYGQSGVDYGTTYKNDICINLSDPSRNGEYEPYEKHSYPLDNSLTLRGIPKLDASNNLYYDGDEYTSNGIVTRKYGVVDLGTIDWVQGGGGNKTSWVPVSWRANVKPVQNTDNKANILCNKYHTDTAEHVEKQVNDKTIAVNRNCWVYIYDSAYVSVTPQAFKEAMSGVYLIYELATPTTETAEPFHNIQIVDDFGTEEFVSTGIVPVGHNTRYPANLRDKLQHLPSLASMDGTYLIKQTGKQMSLVYMPAVFPETPTEDGTYTLKTVVTGGVATLQWVAE